MNNTFKLAKEEKEVILDKRISIIFIARLNMFYHAK